MKYIFHLPIAQAGPGVVDGYVISHNIFLTKEQRIGLQDESAIVETMGSCIPVRVRHATTNEPANEIFCMYRIAHSEPKQIIQEDQGWIIYLPDVRPLINIKDGGSEFLAIVYHDIVTINDTSYPVLHQIAISDWSCLERSIHCCHLPHTVSK